MLFVLLLEDTAALLNTPDVSAVARRLKLISVKFQKFIVVSTMCHRLF